MVPRRNQDLDEIARNRRKEFFAYIAAAILITLFITVFKCG